MGKASSSKKVAKAARAGGNLRTSQGRKWGFPLLVAAVCLGGVGMIVFARQGADELGVPPVLGEHWHAAYGVYICDTFEPPLVDATADHPLGIHTHADGLIHIHPSSSTVTGEKATLGVFADQVDLDFGADSFTLPDGRTFATGDDCGGTPGQVRVLRWASGDLEGEPEVADSDFADVRLLGDGEAFVLAFAPTDAAIPLPPTLSNLENPSDLAPGETGVSVPAGLSGATTTAPGGPATSIPATTATIADGTPPDTADPSVAPTTDGPGGESPTTSSPTDGTAPATTAG